MSKQTALDLGGAGLVLLGGTMGTLGRYGVSLALPTADGWPWPTLAVNVSGAFLLALLLEWLTTPAPESSGRRRVRLLLGTGVLGGYTTYSTLAVETERLLAAGDLEMAAGYCAATLVVGLLAAVGGYLLAARLRGGRVVPESEEGAA